ncbi:MAG: DUF5103 domain-containing protein [Paludibacteraceae bacterium]|nr:DUF5103 domain-containing protein [Paludibacteraceae bacterium]
MKSSLIILLALVTHTIDPDLQTLLIRPADEEVFEISFDELSHDPHFYTYTVTHLNANLEPSELMSSEYVEGFTTADITDYDHSLNTNVPYTHYRFFFPNDDMRITKQGLYALSIYEDGDPDNVVAVAVVPVVNSPSDAPAAITGNVTSHTQREFNGRYQQLDLELKIDPSTRSEDYFIVVRQNDRYDNLVYAPQPTYREPGRLRWVNCRNLIFEGGNEYRHFDIYSTYYAGVGVDKVRYGQGDYYVTLDFDAMRNRGVYTHQYDVNGGRVINAERCSDPDYEAEYMYVHFEYPAPLNSKLSTPLNSKLSTLNLYIGGSLFYNRLTNENRLLYDSEMECYWLDALVKQGGTDYQFWVYSPESGVMVEPTEGSYWQTENDYSVYVYYRPFGSRYDSLVGIYHINSK